MLITPIMMVLLFSFVFGGSIDIAGSSYREYLVAGAFALNLMFGATYAGIGMADDMQKGIIDRFRSLPMSRAAVVVGRTASNAIGHVLTLAIMALARSRGRLACPHQHGRCCDGVRPAAPLRLRDLLDHGLRRARRPSVEVVQSVSGMVVFPLTFIGNTFVPVDNLPTPCGSWPSGTRCRASLKPRANCSEYSGRHGRADRVAATERGGIHAAVGRADHRCLRATRHAQVQASRGKVTGIRRIIPSSRKRAITTLTGQGTPRRSIVPLARHRHRPSRRAQCRLSPGTASRDWCRPGLWLVRSADMGG